MKALRNYIAEKLVICHQQVDEKLVINKNYNDIYYKYYPKNKNELRDVIEEHYANDIYDLNDINTSEIINFSFCFQRDIHTANKNFDISKWNVSKGETFEQMFYNCRYFNCDLSDWDVSNSESFDSMFYNCNKFNSDLSRWNVSKCKDFSWMFAHCNDFTSDISKWNVMEGMDFSNMFYYCGHFNSDLSKWDMSNCLDIRHMFYNCNIEDKYKPKRIK